MATARPGILHAGDGFFADHPATAGHGLDLIISDLQLCWDRGIVSKYRAAILNPQRALTPKTHLHAQAL